MSRVYLPVPIFWFNASCVKPSFRAPRLVNSDCSHSPTKDSALYHSRTKSESECTSLRFGKQWGWICPYTQLEGWPRQEMEWSPLHTLVETMRWLRSRLCSMVTTVGRLCFKHRTDKWRKAMKLPETVIRFEDDETQKDPSRFNSWRKRVHHSFEALENAVRWGLGAKTSKTSRPHWPWMQNVQEIRLGHLPCIPVDSVEPSGVWNLVACNSDVDSHNLAFCVVWNTFDRINVMLYRFKKCWNNRLSLLFCSFFQLPQTEMEPPAHTVTMNEKSSAT